MDLLAAGRAARSRGVEFIERAGSDDDRLVAALLDQGAVALERAELAAATVENEALRRSDKLRAALLNSISHDLRSPLSTVMGSATTLIDYGMTLKADVRSDLLLSIREEAERLNRYVGDLLDMTRLEGGALKTRSHWTDARDVLDAAINRVARLVERRMLTRDFPAELTSVQADPGLLEQAIVNILENAIAYSPDGSRIEVTAYEDRRNVVISIEDEGPGIPPADIERVSRSSVGWRSRPAAAGGNATRAPVSACPLQRASSRPWVGGLPPPARCCKAAGRAS